MMKVVAILGGLGSQMLKYAFYLLIKENADEKCYIDTTPFYMANMWNGYELKRIFGISAPDIVDFYNERELLDLRKSNLGYRKNTIYLMKKIEPQKEVYYYIRGKKRKWSKICNFLYFLKSALAYEKSIYDVYDEEYLTIKENVYYDEFNHTSDKYIKKNKEELKKIFKFPEIDDERNLNMKTQMNNTESVAIHVRRSDHLYDNETLIQNGYYKKAIAFIKNKVENPTFYIFSEDAKWCGDNLDKLGIELDDNYYLIDWNRNEDSYRDMQLMTFCKHNILAISSFSWWGYYLSIHEAKIVCAPKGYWCEIAVHF